MTTPILIKTNGAGVNSGDVVFDILSAAQELPSSSELYDTWQLGSTAGSMNVFVSGDGQNYQSAAIALIDLGSTTRTTPVLSTTAGGNYGIKGRWKGVRVKQTGATAVAGAYLIGYNG